MSAKIFCSYRSRDRKRHITLSTSLSTYNSAIFSGLEFKQVFTFDHLVAWRDKI
jgi:hypothetical protein